MTDRNALIQPDRGQQAIPIHLVNKDSFPDWVKRLSAGQRAALAAQKFEGSGYEHAIVPDGDGWFVAAGVADPDALSSWCLAKLADVLPGGTYRLADHATGRALFGWVSGQYRFERYRSEAKDEDPRVLLTKDARAIDPALREAAAVELVRDLVNTPAEDMGPAELEAVAAALAKAHPGRNGAELHITKGDALEQDFPMVHMVGRAAGRAHAPRMIELEWGDPANPRVAIVGKGICFDSGGLDIKPSSAMLLMKKDMGGAAHALALAKLVMGSALPVRLHLLIPAVENAVSASAFRPGDILATRKKISVEIGNTDAEGRLVLADALTRASEDAPALIIDFATLTGAARVALGPDLPALFTNDESLAEDLAAAASAVSDPLWRLPLWADYADMLKSTTADINNAGEGGQAGAITAALFLQRFVPEGTAWAHLDTFAWRPAARPGRPKGGDALGLRATFAMLKRRFITG